MLLVCEFNHVKQKNPLNIFYKFFDMAYNLHLNPKKPYSHPQIRRFPIQDPNKFRRMNKSFFANIFSSFVLL